MTDTLTIRDAREADLARIVAIYNEAIPGRQATADTEPVTVASRAAWFRVHTALRRPLWVAERDGGILGWLSFQDFYGRPAYAATAEISLYVSTAAQRAGVGGRLLARALDRAPALGLATLVGFVFAHNAASVALFERYGFARWGHLPRVARLDGAERDLLILGRRVEARA
ncbi:MAG TPA: GNAT family N-acetyltransferase [Methylomirabilota bacterium]|nr:GNAT family N-acetyltransferase [Methylomirabilota bacterium]